MFDFHMLQLTVTNFLQKSAGDQNACNEPGHEAKAASMINAEPVLMNFNKKQTSTSTFVQCCTKPSDRIEVLRG
jgi:hypothetical protein